MRPGTKLALTGAVLASLAALAVWITVRAAPAVPAGTGRSVEAVDAARTGANADASLGADASGAGAAPRTVVPPTPEVAAVPPGIGDHPFTFAVDVEVVAPSGVPVAGQAIRVTPIGVDWHDGEQTTDHDGRVALRFAARRPTLLVAFGLAESSAFEVLSLNHGAVRRVVLGAAADEMTGNAYLGTGLRGLRVAMKVDGHGTIEMDLQDDATLVAHLGPLHPFAAFGERARLQRIAAPAEPIPFHWDTLVSSVLTARLRGELSGGTVEFHNARVNVGLTSVQLNALEGTTLGPQLEALFAREALAGYAAAAGLPPPPPPKPALSGSVRGEDGAPLANQPVAWRLGPDQAWQLLTTGEGGSFELPAGTEGTVQLRAGGGPQGIAEHSCALVPGTTAQVVVWLSRGRIVRGVAVDATGSALADHVVEWRGVDLAEHARCATGADGRFELPNRTGPGRAWLRAKDTGATLAVSAIVHPDGPDVLLQAEPASGSLTLQAQRPPGCQAFSMRAFVWDTVTGHGRRLTPDGDGRVRLENMRAGTYRVVVHADALGSIDLGGYWIDGATCRDLGTVGWPAPGNATFERQNVGDGVQRVEELHRVGADLDLRIDGFTATTTQVSLAPGTYLWSWRDGEGDAASKAFTVGTGGALTVQR